MNGLQSCLAAFVDAKHEIHLPEHTIAQARSTIQRMLDFAAAYRQFGPANSDLAQHIANFTLWVHKHEHAKNLL